MFLNKPIENITPFSLLDFQDLSACIIWFSGCNMRCSYCYNPEIVFGKGKYSFDDVYQFLNKRKNLLDGVVLSGGECTIHKELIPFVQEIKRMGFKIKLDTNGTYPDKVKKLVNDQLIDFISLDFKAMKNKFYTVTSSKHHSKFVETFLFLVQSKFPFEMRTTYHDELFQLEDLNNMIEFIEQSGYKSVYYIQNFFNNSETIGHLANSKKLKLEKLNPTSLHIQIRN